MKFAVVIALFGLTAATQRHAQKSFIQTKFVNFNELGDGEEAPEPTAEDLRVRAEVAAKAKKIAVSEKEVLATEEADLVKTNKEKGQEAKKLAKAMSKAAGKKGALGEDEDAIACGKQRDEADAEKAAKDKKFTDFVAMVKDKSSDMDWAASMSDDIVSHNKFKSGPLKYANIQLNWKWLH